MTEADAAIRQSGPLPLLAIDVAVDDPRWYEIDDDPEAVVRRAVAAAVGRAGLADRRAEISIVLADDVRVQRLNRDFRNQDRPTNVLSFPMDQGGGPWDPAAPVMLGDVVLAFNTVAREAREQSKSPLEHTLHLVVHGVLHLIGYDHGTQAEARKMERLERKVLADLGVADPYLERPSPA